MCGIGGILRITPPGQSHEPVPEAWLDFLDEGVAWRGPDGHGRFRDRATTPDGAIVEVALVHRRLAIIDLEGGAQPMVSARGRVRPDGTIEGLVAVVFNGCLYNHRALRAELEALGHRFVTDHSDTEVLIHGWREWGTELPARLDGMYAFAVWDRDAARVVVARDPAGEKPLYLSSHHSDLLFASSFAVFARAAESRVFGQPGAIDPPSTLDWIALGWAPQSTPLRAVAQAPAGAIGGEGPAPPPKARRRHDPPRDAPIRDLDDLEHEVRAAVESRLESDVPLGCFLSGGIDSSVVAWFARDALGSLTTLTVRMPDDRFDESAAARAVAEHLGTSHVEVECDAHHAASDLVQLIETLGLPFGDSSLLPAYWLCRAARAHVKVALTGDGGDEVFAGYDRYRACRWFLAWTPVRLAMMFVPIGVLDRRDPASRPERLARLIGACRHRGYTDLLACFDSRDFARLTDRPPGPLMKAWRFDPPASVRRFDLENYLPGDLMRKVDTASMMAGIEARAPLLAPRLVRRAFVTPLSRLTPGGRPKWLLRQLAARRLPESVVNRPKQGFAIPLSEWWRTDFGGLRTLMLDHLTSADPFPGLDALNLRMNAVRRMIDEHMAADPSGAAPPVGRLSKGFGRLRPRDHAQRLYVLTVLSIWSKWLRRAGAEGRGDPAAP